MDDFADAAVYAYSTWPKGTPNYYALPAMGDANGWFYRADWFADPEDPGRLPGRDRAGAAGAAKPDRTDADRPVLPGAGESTARPATACRFSPSAARGHHYGREPARSMPGGIPVRNRARQLSDGGRGQLAGGDRGAGVLQGNSTSAATPAGATPTATWSKSLDAFKSGQVAMAMKLVRLLPRGLYADPDVGGRNRIGFFRQPAAERSRLDPRRPGGSRVVAYFRQPGKRRWNTSSGLPQPPRSRPSGGDLGGYAVHKQRVEQPGVRRQPAVRGATSLEAMNNVRDFWQEPAYAELLLAMQKRLHD